MLISHILEILETNRPISMKFETSVDCLYLNRILMFISHILKFLFPPPGGPPFNILGTNRPLSMKFGMIAAYL